MSFYMNEYSSVIRCLPTMYKALGLISALHKLVLVANTCNPSTQRSEDKRIRSSRPIFTAWQVWEQSGLHDLKQKNSFNRDSTLKQLNFCMCKRHMYYKKRGGDIRGAEWPQLLCFLWRGREEGKGGEKKQKPRTLWDGNKSAKLCYRIIVESLLFRYKLHTPE